MGMQRVGSRRSVPKQMPPAVAFFQSQVAGITDPTMLGLASVVALKALAPGAGIGRVPTTAAAMGMTPSVQYHPHTATMPMRADGQVTGYISGNVLTIPTTGWVESSGQALREGVILNSPNVAAGTMILKPNSNANAAAMIAAPGNAGSYYVSISQTVGSAASPVVFTYASQEITSISDTMGNAPISLAVPGTAPDCSGPAPMIDAMGRRFLRFRGSTVAYAWLRNLTLTGLDTANMTWFMVGRIFGQNSGASGQYSSGTLVAIGTKEAGNASVNMPSQISFTSAMPAPNHANLAYTNSTTSNINKMFCGTQMQVLGTVCATTDGLNGSSSLTTTASNRYIQSWVNEQSVSLSYSPTGQNRLINTTGFTVGMCPSNTNNGDPLQFDLYELVGFVGGQMGVTMANIPAKAAQISAALMANWSIPPITKNLLLTGDSRSCYGDGGNAGEGNDGSNFSLPNMLTEPGATYAVPANTRVMGIAVGGNGVARARSMIDKSADYVGNSAIPGNVNFMLGGGNDYCAFYMGGNEGQGNVWPTTTAGGGLYAPNSQPLGDDIYNGAGYSITGTITNSANGIGGTFTTTSGTFFGGARITSAGFSPGQAISSISGSNITFTNYEPTAHTSTAVTLRFDGYIVFVNTLLARGFKVLAAVEPNAPAGNAQTSAGRVEFGYRLITNLVTDIGSANVHATDLTQINSVGTYPFGLNYEGQTVAGVNFFDLNHHSRLGKINLLSGANTPGLGFASQINALLAT